MSPHDLIVVGVDGSRGSAAAVRFAAQEARRWGVSIHLVHVVPNFVPLTPMFPLLPSDLTDTGREILNAAAADARLLLPDERVSTSLLDGPRFPTLDHAATDARLLVLGSQRHSTVERLLTGSTLLGVASRTSCPVVAVPDAWVPNVGAQQTVIAGIKSTDQSREFVRRVFETAEDRHARVLLVHAWQLPAEYDDIIFARVDRDEWTVRAVRSIERSLGGLREAYPNVPVEIRVEHGQAARVLERASRGAELMVLARRARAFPFGHLGGTARALLRESHCPVEILPPADQPDERFDAFQERAEPDPLSRTPILR